MHLLVTPLLLGALAAGGPLDESLSDRAFEVMIHGRKDAHGGPDNPFDVVVYGGTSAGVAAAVQAARWGNRPSSSRRRSTWGAVERRARVDR